MTGTLLKTAITDQEQRFLLPGIYTWQEFEALEHLLTESPGLRITYLDGWIELMTLSETHEQLKSLLGMFLEAYLIAMSIEFIPVGQATRRGEAKRTSFEPDESYYLGEQKEHPDLAIEVILTSGSLDKLEKYRRFSIQEVWFWQDNQLQLYTLTPDGYQEVPSSQLLPNLPVATLVRCVQMPSRLEAMRIWQASFSPQQ